MFNRLRHLLGRQDRYDRIRLTAESIERQDYKCLFGGGSRQWETRGAFQLHFLRAVGLQPDHRVLDVGCGPLRAGSHLIQHLDEHGYWAFDSNADFIDAARSLIAADARLRAKQPRVEVIREFDFSALGDCRPDFVLAFSVLNHCRAARRRAFLQNLPSVLKPTSKVYISHASWFAESHLEHTALRQTRVIDSPEHIAPSLRPVAWGWSPAKRIPIVELMLARIRGGAGGE